VTGEVVQPVRSGEARLAAARSRAYAVLADLFEYPDAELCEAVRAGEVALLLREALAAVAAPLGEGGAAALADAGCADDLAVEYTRLFDVGPGGPPCPLYEGAYGAARTTVMEECLRFYRHFGLTLAESPRELPDHLVTELEFLHFLAFREAEACERGGDPGPFRRAARDFLARHAGRLARQLEPRLARADACAFFRALGARLAAFLAHDEAWLVALEGPPPAGAPPRRAS
jgi:DMSO reductase family type II enzyme chaperone